jgi:hypothetical protein
MKGNVPSLFVLTLAIVFAPFVATQTHVMYNNLEISLLYRLQ